MFGKRHYVNCKMRLIKISNEDEYPAYVRLFVRDIHTLWHSWPLSNLQMDYVLSLSFILSHLIGGGDDEGGKAQLLACTFSFCV